MLWIHFYFLYCFYLLLWAILYCYFVDPSLLILTLFDIVWWADSSFWADQGGQTFWFKGLYETINGLANRTGMATKVVLASGVFFGPCWQPHRSEDEDKEKPHLSSKIPPAQQSWHPLRDSTQLLGQQTSPECKAKGFAILSTPSIDSFHSLDSKLTASS